MTCYIPPIERPEAVYTIHIRRYDPEDGMGVHWKSYRIPFMRTMTVVQALEYLWDQGEYIAFRANCREFTCGSCAMLVNGKPRLACDTLLEDQMRIEPLSRYPVVKDLVVDTGRVKEKFRELELWPEGRDRQALYNPSKHVLEKYRRVYSRCIECYCCLEACLKSDSEGAAFDGPMYLLQLARVRDHPLDARDRIAQAGLSGMWLCVNCYECADACPIDLSPVSLINQMRFRAILDKFTGLFWKRRTSTRC